MTPEATVVPLEVAALAPAYRFLAEIGRGGTAVVYLAEDRETRQSVAIKVIQSPLVGDDETRRRFTHEARTASRLRHPNIVGVHAVELLEDGALAMVMQYVPGGTLKQLILQRAPLPFPVVERVLRDIAAALVYAHDQGIIHRDVKPENIFLDATTGAALLADFGIARTTECAAGVTLEGMALGTPAYMAPEQIDGRKVDGRTDLYSLACVGWEMLTGAAPWEGESLYGVIHNQKHAHLPSLRQCRPGIPPLLLATIEKALTKDPERRFRDAREFVASLGANTLSRLWIHLLTLGERWRQVTSGELPAPVGPEVAAATSSAASVDDCSLTVRYVRPQPHAVPAVPREAPGEAPAPPPAAGQRPFDAPTTDTDRAELPGERPRWQHAWQSLRLPQHAAAAGLPVLAVLAGALLALLPDAPTGSWLELSPLLSAAEPGAVPSGSRPSRAAELLRMQNGSTLQAVAAALAPFDRQPILGMDARPANGEIANGAAAAADATPALEPAAADVEPSATAAEPPATAAVADPGNAAEATAAVPARAPAPPRPVAVLAGGLHTCTLFSQGRAFCWGGNSAGQIGSGTGGRVGAPAAIGGNFTFRDLAAGVSHNCGITSNGKAYCWGSNRSGELGDDSGTAQSTPVAVVGSRSYTAIGTGERHSCAVTAQGQVWCWGENSAGQLGDGSTTSHTRPVRAGGGPFASLALGWNHSCALDRQGRAHCWGANGDGQLGTGGTSSASAPTPVAAQERFQKLAAGASHTCALNRQGTAMCWGQNANGQLGDGTSTEQHTPQAVVGGHRFTAITAGSTHTCALSRTGEALCWGRNSYGQLGDGTTSDRSSPVRVEGRLRFVTLHASGAHTCGITRDGVQYCWGYNVEGQLGDGSRSHRSRPVKVTLPEL